MKDIRISAAVGSIPFQRGITALITGASSGIGEQLARVFARNGYDVVLTARSAGRLTDLATELASKHGVAARAMSCDLSQPGAEDGLCGELDAADIQVDVLVNNAGLIAYGPFISSDAARERDVTAVNVVAMTGLMKRLIPPMVSRGHGRVLNVGSTGSFVPGPYNSVYCATKAYVLSISEAVASELEGTGVTVTALCPGATRTALQSNAGIGDIPLLKRGVMDARTVAEKGYRGLVRGKRVVVPGAWNKVQVFSARIMPRRVIARIAKWLMTPGTDGAGK